MIKVILLACVRRIERVCNKRYLYTLLLTLISIQKKAICLYVSWPSRFFWLWFYSILPRNAAKFF